MPRQVPYDICENIIDILGGASTQISLDPPFSNIHGWKRETATLLSCALVCRSWKRRAQMHILSIIDICISLFPDEEDETTLTSHNRSQAQVAGQLQGPFSGINRLNRITEILSRSVELASFVESLRITTKVFPAEWMSISKEALRNFRNLMRDNTIPRRCQHWFHQNQTLFTTLLDVIPSVTHLRLSFDRITLNEDLKSFSRSIQCLLGRSARLAFLDLTGVVFPTPTELVTFLTTRSSIRSLRLGSPLESHEAFNITSSILPISPLLKLESLVLLDNNRSPQDSILRLLLHPRNFFRLQTLVYLDLSPNRNSHNLQKLVEDVLVRCTSLRHLEIQIWKALSGM
jgi:hypothetical protein